jgi:hypothetical protein
MSEPIIRKSGNNKDENAERVSHLGINPVKGGRPPKDIRRMINNVVYSGEIL